MFVIVISYSITLGIHTYRGVVRGPPSADPLPRGAYSAEPKTVTGGVAGTPRSGNDDEGDDDGDDTCM